jgi:hypothetical protein
MTTAPAAAGLTFTHEGHRYRLDGVPVPSVTTIIRGGIPSPALIDWAGRVVAEAAADHPSLVEAVHTLGRDQVVAMLAATPNAIRNRGGVRGTQVHDLAEAVVHGEAVEVDAQLDGYVSGYARWLDRSKFVPEWSEWPVASRHYGYAGRFDVMGMIGETRWLVDIKTSRSVYGDTALQVAAYARAEFMVDHDVEWPIPAVDRIGVLHVREDGTDLYDLGSIDDAFVEFLHAFGIYRTSGRRAGLITKGTRPVGFSS